MKVLMLNGSFNPDGSTSAGLEIMAKTFTEEGVETEIVTVGGKPIADCIACGKCAELKRCVFANDGVNEFAAKAKEADGIVFSMPVYWYSIPAQIKGVIDKLYSFFIGGKAEQVAGKSAAIITCCEEADPSVMDGVKIPMERTAALLQWNMVGEVLVPGVNEAGAIANTDGCAQAAALADKF